ncbi:MAG: aminoacyl-tRNA hydrolase [Candidatus Omnitrophica bacterium]|nr:aminoacyl-tRNA hydrolase [Candidatus Omnitrophota bacterium]
MKIIVGLGNPGKEYANTRHNVGFMVLEELAARHGIRIKKKGFSGVYGTGKVGTNEVLLFEPLTYMNLSGGSVAAVTSKHGTEIKDILVVADDFNILFGVLRMRQKGSSGGHHGLDSIIENMGNSFNRLRIGIGHEGMPEEKSGYVLSAFTKEESRVLPEVIDRAAACVETWIGQGVEKAMSGYN